MARWLLPAVALLLVAVALAPVAGAGPAAPSSAERGKAALEGTAFIPAFWPTAAYDNAWKGWGVTEKPADYAAAFRARYGLHPAPYPNGDLPMGLRKAGLLFGTGIGIDCMTCHGSSIIGESRVGLGNSSLDIQGLFEDMAGAGGSARRTPFAFSQVRGTSEAGAFSVFLLGLRNDDLTLSLRPRDLGLHDDTCGDVPAWWTLKKKRTLYHTGTTDADSARTSMQFLMHPLTTRADFDKHEPAFRDIRDYLLTLDAPKYPFPVDAALATAGKHVFANHCAKCHGRYGDAATYPNKIVPIDAIGTDRKRYDNIRETFAAAYNTSWFAADGHPVADTAGYQAPPLDGVWATAPYFHNGSVPTLAGVLDSTSRPKVFTRSFETNEADYDRSAVGWRVREVAPPPAKTSGFERRKVYDTTKPGRSNAGHTYGDDLTPADRRAVIEYLKTL